MRRLRSAGWPGDRSLSKQVDATRGASIELSFEAPVAEFALHMPRIKERNIRLERRFEPGLKLQAITGEMHQVFSNLIDNAVAALEDGGKLIVSAYSSREWSGDQRQGVRIVVADNGSGIEHCNAKRIFEPFFSTKGQKGTGLGLWVSKGIVHKHGGSIRVHSSTRQGKSGCVFSVFLPA